MAHPSTPLRRAVSAGVLALGLTLTTAVGGTLAQEGRTPTAAVCLSAQVDYFLKIDDVPGDSLGVSVEEQCGEGTATIAVTVSPAAPQRPAETIIVIVGQCPPCDPSPNR
jgi:hypothetical protein